MNRRLSQTSFAEISNDIQFPNRLVRQINEIERSYGTLLLRTQSRIVQRNGNNQSRRQARKKAPK